MPEVKIATQNLNHLAYMELKQKIINKELPPGTRLVDSQLAGKYGISRTPMRDAIRRLAQEGLVISRPQRGYEVFKATPRDVSEIFEVRLMIETAVITKLLTQTVPSDPQTYLEKFEQIEKRLERDMGKDDPETFCKYDETFHESLIRLAGNERITAIYIENQNQTKAFRTFTSANPERVYQANDMHVKIIRSLGHRELCSALDAVKTHLQICQKYVLDSL